MNVAVVKYNAGNVYSVVNALRRLGVEPVLTDDAGAIRSADKVVFPGQGEYGNKELAAAGARNMHRPAVALPPLGRGRY